MKTLMMTMLITAVITAGCSKSEKPSLASSDKKSDGVVSIPQALIGEKDQDEHEILISVNGVDLTRGEALRQVDLRLGGPPPADMPKDRVAMIQTQTLSKVIDEFVKRELLLREADRLGIVATEEEIGKAAGNIRGKTPGQEPQGILESGPAGKDSLQNEIITGIRIEKLLANVLPPAQEPSDSEIAVFLEENQEKLKMPERVQARHILVNATPDTPAELKEKKRELAESYRQQLLNGADFAELASSVSHCPSASRGGGLGMFPRGKMVKAFEDAAFSQKEGEIGAVVETPFGFHVIRVEKHLEAGLADREQIISILKQRARILALADYVRTLQSTAEIKHSATVRPPAVPSATQSNR